ncbi:hypothetical protein F1654_10125 [Alkalicaulis satelles]|uniref:Uncharacterized protein n=1 Tax=Alkalicaulis satelles TaxID=2609175 RepID=A0A5M6ZBX0_9PROT|nr:hypothetical protein [Alkalicaulis satelles]KAA5802189.1 hypothetical protein F1654_10125 [Alkalicaulis satelles]
MFGGDKAAQRRRDEMRLASEAADHALEALAAGDMARARRELSAAPKKIALADGGWKPLMASAVIDLAAGKRRPGLEKLMLVCDGLDDTSLSRDDKAYLRLYALYRAIDASKDGRAPRELRDRVEDFRFDHTLVSGDLKARFPLKKVEETSPAPPPMAPPPSSGEPF